ncbi:MAG TPA: hypothetical protein VGF17_14350 [Phytomonospora sp.]
METPETRARGFGRALWSTLAVLALTAVAIGVVYVNRGGEDSAGRTPAGADSLAQTEPVASDKAHGTIDGTYYYNKYTEQASELWSWKPGGQPTSVYKTSKSKLVSDARVSPDGRYLSFLVTGSQYPLYNLVVRDLETKTERTIAKDLLQGGEYCMDATWAPDGRPMILTQVGIDGKGNPVLRWFNTETGDKSNKITVQGCFARPVARGDDGFDLFYVKSGTTEIYRQTPDGKLKNTGIGAAIEQNLGEPVLGLGDLSADGKRACLTVGEGNGPRGRTLDCKIVVDVAAKTVVYMPDGGFKGPVLFLDDGRTSGRFSGHVSLMAADGSPIARADEPAAVKTFYMLGYVE